MRMILRVSVSARGYPGPRSHRARRPHTFAATMARSCPCRCWPLILRWRSCASPQPGAARIWRAASRAERMLHRPAHACRGVKGMGEKYSTNDTAHSLAHTVDSVVYSDSVLHNARLLSRLTTCGAAWWAWATGLSLSCRHRLCVDQEMGGAHTLTHTRTRTHSSWDTR